MGYWFSVADGRILLACRRGRPGMCRAVDDCRLTSSSGPSLLSLPFTYEWMALAVAPPLTILHSKHDCSGLASGQALGKYWSGEWSGALQAAGGLLAIAGRL